MIKTLKEKGPMCKKHFTQKVSNLVKELSSLNNKWLRRPQQP